MAGLNWEAGFQRDANAVLDVDIQSTGGVAVPASGALPVSASTTTPLNERLQDGASTTLASVNPVGTTPTNVLGVQGSLTGVQTPSIQAPLPLSTITHAAVTQLLSNGTTAAGAQITATLTPGVTTFAWLAEATIALTTGTAGVAIVAITGLSTTYNVAVATPTTGANVYHLTFNPPLQSSAVNTAIVVTVPAVGGASAVNTVSAAGYAG